MPQRAAVAVAAFGIVLGATYVLAQQRDDTDEHETAIRRSDLPASVEKTVAAESVRARVKGITREVENGTTFYEAELIVDGHTRDVLMDEHGTIVEIEEQVTFTALPATVRAALTTRVGGGRITRVESLTKHGRIVAYEAHVFKKGVRSEVQVGPNGEALDHEE
jgi:hypothetical protein